jgi:hypothetical protein
MNETLSLVIATAILSAGGLGLYMYKSSDEEQNGGDNYNESSFFDSNLFSSRDDDTNDNFIENEIEIFEPKVVRSRGGKTKRNKKSVGTKRRY